MRCSWLVPEARLIHPGFFFLFYFLVRSRILIFLAMLKVFRGDDTHPSPSLLTVVKYFTLEHSVGESFSRY